MPPEELEELRHLGARISDMMELERLRASDSRGSSPDERADRDGSHDDADDGELAGSRSAEIEFDVDHDAVGCVSKIKRGTHGSLCIPFARATDSFELRVAGPTRSISKMLTKRKGRGTHKKVVLTAETQGGDHCQLLQDSASPDAFWLDVGSATGCAHAPLRIVVEIPGIATELSRWCGEPGELTSEEACSDRLSNFFADWFAEVGRGRVNDVLPAKAVEQAKNIARAGAKPLWVYRELDATMFGDAVGALLASMAAPTQGELQRCSTILSSVGLQEVAAEDLLRYVSSHWLLRVVKHGGGPDAPSQTLSRARPAAGRPPHSLAWQDGKRGSSANDFGFRSSQLMMLCGVADSSFIARTAPADSPERPDGAFLVPHLSWWAAQGALGTTDGVRRTSHRSAPLVETTTFTSGGSYGAIGNTRAYRTAGNRRVAANLHWHEGSQSGEGAEWAVEVDSKHADGNVHVSTVTSYR